MTAPTVGELTPTAGVLASGGSAMVRALVYFHAVPENVPEALTDVVEPVHDTDGTLRDWRLHLPSLLRREGGATELHGLRRLFVEWRSGYVSDSLLGDVATVRAFVRWGDRLLDVSALHVLNLPECRVDAKAAPRVAFQARAAAKIARSSHEQCLGITSPQRTGIVRGFVLADTPLVVLETDRARICATRQGLKLFEMRHGEPEGEEITVRGWVVGTDGVRAYTDSGEVALGTSVRGRLLAHVAPGVDQASVSMVPLTTLFSGLFVSLPEMAMLTVRNGTSMIITSQY
jgi:hypothetical protein